MSPLEDVIRRGNIDRTYLRDIAMPNKPSIPDSAVVQLGNIATLLATMSHKLDDLTERIDANGKRIEALLRAIAERHV